MPIDDRSSIAFTGIDPNKQALGAGTALIEAMRYCCWRKATTRVCVQARPNGCKKERKSSLTISQIAILFHTKHKEVSMRVISNKRLREFAQDFPDADEALQTWRKLIECTDFQGFNDLKNTFGAVDTYENKYIFDIRGNHYRIITGISFAAQICYIKQVLTHAEYDKGKWK